MALRNTVSYRDGLCSVSPKFLYISIGMFPKWLESIGMSSFRPDDDPVLPRLAQRSHAATRARAHHHHEVDHQDDSWNLHVPEIVHTKPRSIIAAPSWLTELGQKCCEV